MKQLQVSQVVAAPPEAVFRAATDFAGAPGRISAIKRVTMLTDGPARVGTRFEETREMFGREATETMEVTSLEAPRSVVLAALSHGCRYRSQFRFEPEGDGTRVTMTFAAEPRTLFAKVMSVLMAAMARRLVEACSRDLRDLAAHCEGASPGS